MGAGSCGADGDVDPAILRAPAVCTTLTQGQAQMRCLYRPAGKTRSCNAPLVGRWGPRPLPIGPRRLGNVACFRFGASTSLLFYLEVWCGLDPYTRLIIPIHRCYYDLDRMYSVDTDMATAILYHCRLPMMSQPGGTQHSPIHMPVCLL